MTAEKARKVLITGAAQGIGRASALRLAKAGFHVIASDVNREKLSELQGVENIQTEALDVLDRADMDALIARVGTIDVLFNCAGVVHNGTVQTCSRSDLEFAWQLNVCAQYELIQAVLPGMLAQQEGCIINMASVASSIKGVPDRFAYSVTKAAVIGLTKSVAADYITQGIRCNAICPGTVDSPSLQQRLRAQGDYEAARKAFIARQPIGRIGSPQEIADLVLYLADASFTTGQIHIIDGGWAA